MKTTTRSKSDISETQGLRRYVLLFLKGMGMGGADVVPGVSGGTIAFITGIYEELLDSIKKFDWEAVTLLRKGRLADLWRHVNAPFLLSVLGGIFLSLVTLSRLISYILTEYPIQVWSFFFGLIVIATVMVAREIRKWDLKVILAGLIGIAIAYYITIATPAETPTALWFIFLSGAIAICAMILPGISGAFILLILGKYEYVINALRDFDIATIVVFGLGCATGIISFARAVSWLLKNYYNTAIALLAGFMVGSLNKIWPWKLVVEYRIDSHGIEKPLLEQNVLPETYLAETGSNPYVFQAILFMFAGIALVTALELVAQALKKKADG